MESDQFSCIIADPPYGVEAGAFGDAAKLAHRYTDTPAAARDIAECIFAEAARVAKSQAHLYLFCDIAQFTALQEIAASHGWKPWRTPLVWHKGTSGFAPMMSGGWRRTYELILFASKGHMPLNSLADDVIRISNLRDKVHAAQKPDDLYASLIKCSCIPGDQILDPCCGSGTIFRAAAGTSTIATGIELDPDAHGQALLAIQELPHGQEEP